MAILGSVPAPLWAQEWTLDLYLGRAIYDPVSAAVGANNGVLGLRYHGLDGDWFYLSAAAPIDGVAPLWGALGAGRRLTLGAGRFSAGIDLGAHGHGYRNTAARISGAGATLQALPFAVLGEGAARLELRSGLLHYRGGAAGLTEARTLHDSGARLTLRASSALELGGEARYVRVAGRNYPYFGASAALAHGRGEFWASTGRWTSEALPDLSWSIGASLQLGRYYETWAAIRQEPSDPLYWNSARQSWNIGVSRRLGRIAPAAAPVPAEISNGRVVIRIPLSESRTAPFLAGDFTGWKPVAMDRAGEFWVASLALKPGVYHYAFRTARGKWFVPETVPGRRADGFGGFVAVLTVP
jgi:hypothetical protein